MIETVNEPEATQSEELVEFRVMGLDTEFGRSTRVERLKGLNGQMISAYEEIPGIEGFSQLCIIEDPASAKPVRGTINKRLNTSSESTQEYSGLINQINSMFDADIPSQRATLIRDLSQGAVYQDSDGDLEVRVNKIGQILSRPILEDAKKDYELNLLKYTVPLGAIPGCILGGALALSPDLPNNYILGTILMGTMSGMALAALLTSEYVGKKDVPDKFLNKVIGPGILLNKFRDSWERLSQLRTEEVSPEQLAQYGSIERGAIANYDMLHRLAEHFSNERGLSIVYSGNSREEVLDTFTIILPKSA